MITNQTHNGAHLPYYTLRPFARSLARPSFVITVYHVVILSHCHHAPGPDLISMHAYQISMAEARGKDACAHAIHPNAPKHSQQANTLSLASE